MRHFCRVVTLHPLFGNVIIGLLLLNALILGLETYPLPEHWHHMLKLGDHALLAIFVIEISMRMIAQGKRFFRSNWNMFDLIVTTIALLPVAEAFVGLRTLRVLRVLRLFSAVPQLRRVINSLLMAIPGISSVVIISLLVFYVFAIIATNLFGAAFPQWFGTLGESMFTLFQIMTLENWASEIARSVLVQYPHAWIFFVTFILITTFVTLNMFIAILINAMQSDSNIHRRKSDPEGFNPTPMRRSIK